MLALVLTGFLGLSMAPTLSADSQGQDHRTYPEFKPSFATETQIIKKQSSPGKGKPANPPTKPGNISSKIATGILGGSVTGNKYAIVIGISDYPGTVNDLQYADNDALAMQDVLIRRYGFLESNITLLTDMKATVSSIGAAINDIKSKVVSGDEVVFFYSGHGGTGRADDGDDELTDESIVSHDGISLVHIWDGDLKALFSGFATSRIVFLFDSCASGGMTDLASTGRIINMATMEKRFDTAVESVYNGVGAGEFTYYFVIKGMGEYLADVSGTEGLGVVTTEEAYDYMKANVKTDHPTVYDGFGNDLLL